MTSFQSRKEGFALIITISLMAFLVLLLVSLSTLTRVETQLAGSSQQMQTARENARLALDVAVAQLQRYAGPDTAVTARADIDPNFADPNTANPYWTGVWDGNTLETWLVSGNEDPVATVLAFEPDAYFAAEDGEHYETGAAVRLVDSGTAWWNATSGKVEGAVVAPRVPLYADDYPGRPGVPSVVGHYAYWVGDQGIKASIAKVERHLDVEAWGSGPTPEQQILRQLMPQRFGHHPIFSNLGTIENDQDYKFRLGQVQSYPQMRVAAGQQYDSYGTPARDALRAHFHDITHFNMGVLSSPTRPGLKLDLSSYVRSDSVGSGGGLPGVTDFMRAILSDGSLSEVLENSITYEMEAPETFPASVEEASLRISPIVTEALFDFLIWVDEGTRELQVQVDVQVEIWNPFNVTLLGNDLFLGIDNLPNVRVHHNGTDLGQIDFEATFTGILSDFVFSSGPVMPPGTIRVENFSTTATSALDPDEAEIVMPPADAGPPVQDEWSLSATNFSGIRVELRLGDSQDPLLSRYVFDHFDPPLDTGPIQVDEEPGSRFGLYFRMRDGGADDDRWLTYYNPLGMVLTDLDDGTAAARLPNDPDPFETELDVADAGNRSLNSAAGEWLSPGSVLTLFELPTQDVVSIGSLQHVYFHGLPTYPLGNPWGGSVNAIFDEYFISTIPNSATADPNEFPLPHTGMIPYKGNGNNPFNAELLSDESARHLLLKGMFNINSTSIDAWRSILSSLNIEGDHHDTGWQYQGGERDLRNAFFRYSQTGDMLTTYTESQAQLSTVNRAFNQGVRELTDAEMTDLASEIVHQLQTRGTPFETLGDFIDSGIIRDAIDTVSSINDGIPELSPAYLTQADIITAMAPFMLARSDTFLVRAYGDATNPLTGAIEGRAWCEAIVQRVPTPFDPSADVIDPSSSAAPGGQFGRKFEIIYFRWLSANEI